MGRNVFWGGGGGGGETSLSWGRNVFKLGVCNLLYTTGAGCSKGDQHWPHKEDMFPVSTSIFLFICLSLGHHKTYQTDVHVSLWKGWPQTKDQLIKFWLKMVWFFLKSLGSTTSFFSCSQRLECAPGKYQKQKCYKL